MILKVIVLCIIFFISLVTFSICKAAGRADEWEEKMLLEQRQKIEKEKF